MKGFLILLSIAYSAQAWHEVVGPLHIATRTGVVPQKSAPLSAEDKHATHKAGAFVSFVKSVPQMNPFKFANLGPYPVTLPEVKFDGKLQLTNIVVQGIKDISVSGLEVRMNPPRVDFNASLPHISAAAHFTVNGVLEGKPLNVKGQLTANLEKILAVVAAGPTVAQHGNTKVYEVNSADAVIDLSKLDVVLNMDQHAEKFRTIALEFVNNLSKYSLIVDDVLRAVLKAISHELKQLTVNEINNYLLGSAKPSLHF
ncbi:hypothetical protein HW555_007063 [Spodoptera exigua]|uniref:Uncharacterized protein n=1 Tax=Spodoptera exigua TaxID=7107 RepID=A0A835GFR2_SPOEX|nr:hypothetical protein HW555_007063 [Spodoptera exigua]